MGKTSIFKDLILANWGPGELLHIRDVHAIAAKYHISESASTVQRTTQELRDLGILDFVDGQGTYRRRAAEYERGSNPFDQIKDARRLRDSRFAGQSGYQEMVDARIARLEQQLLRQRVTSFQDIPDIIEESKGETETITNVMARLGQGKFREKLIGYWKGCAVTGCDLLPVLRASHIKPWRVANAFERLDEFNGLLLVPHLDALFDEGLISFDENGALMVSNLVTAENRKLFQLATKSKVKVEERHLPYLQYHRKEVFID